MYEAFYDLLLIAPLHPLLDDAAESAMEAQSHGASDLPGQTRASSHQDDEPKGVLLSRHLKLLLRQRLNFFFFQLTAMQATCQS